MNAENKEIPPSVCLTVTFCPVCSFAMPQYSGHNFWFLSVSCNPLGCLGKQPCIKLAKRGTSNSSEDMFLITDLNVSYPCFVFHNNATALIFSTSVNTINCCKFSKEAPLIPEVKREEATRWRGTAFLPKVSTKDSAMKPLQAVPSVISQLPSCSICGPLHIYPRTDL